MSQTKRTTTARRKDGAGPRAKSPGSEPPADSDIRPAGRRFTPSERRVTVGGSIYGTLVANRRARLGLSQRELAARIHASPYSVARIEQGQPPSAEMLMRLMEVLNPEPPAGAVRPSDAWAAAGDRVRALPTTVRSPWLWGALAAVIAVLLALILGGRISSDDLILGRPIPSADSGALSVAVSNGLGAPAAIHRARVQAQKAAAAEARKAAERARERERAAAAAASAAARKAAAKTARQSTPASTPPVIVPVAPSPAPSGGGGSSAPAPSLQHGIGGG